MKKVFWKNLFGNESKNRLTQKISSFFAHFLTPLIIDQKTGYFWQPSYNPQGHVLGLNWVKSSHLKFVLIIFNVRMIKSVTRRSRSHEFWGNMYIFCVRVSSWAIPAICINECVKVHRFRPFFNPFDYWPKNRLIWTIFWEPPRSFLRSKLSKAVSLEICTNYF